MAIARQEALDWARRAVPGDYLIEYDEAGGDADSDPGSRCGFDDEVLAAVEAELRRRDLSLVADDVGLVAAPREGYRVAYGFEMLVDGEWSDACWETDGSNAFDTELAAAEELPNLARVLDCDVAELRVVPVVVQEVCR